MIKVYHGRRGTRTDNRGTAALEFALIATPILVVFFGIIYVSILAYTTNSLEYAVQEGARCASVRKAVCSDAAKTQSYAASHYYGFGKPSFLAELNAGCGSRVGAMLTHDWDFAVFKYTVPVTATACFP
jgi:hypothetical protein